MEIKNLLKVHQLRPIMMKHIYVNAAVRAVTNPEPTTVYADEQELAAMEVCHPQCIDILTKFFAQLPQRATHRALDVAGGDGRLSKNLLVKQYNKVDLFDGCPRGVAKAREALKGHKNFGYAEQAYMESFRWYHYYSAIFMVWCVGYLDRNKLVAFLR